MSGINIFLVICFWIFLPIQYVTFRNNLISKKNLILSVTLPPEAQQDEEVGAYLEAFRKRFFRVFLLLTLALLPALFLPWLSVAIMWELVWMLAALYGSCWVYGRGYEGLKAIKRRRGWQTGAAGKLVVEMQPLKLPKPIKTGWFVPPMILSVLPVISCLADELDPAWSMMLMITAFTGLSVTVGSLVFYGLIFRQKADVMDDNAERTAALTRVRRYNWAKTWLLMSWLTGLYSMAIWISPAAMLPITLVYSVALIAVTLATEFAVRRAQARLSGNTPAVVDEDDYWIWGQFYYNPNSPKAFVQERVGMGMSMNFATKAGKAMAVFTAVVLLSLIPLGIWLMSEELSQTEMVYTQEQILVTHGGTTYEVAVDEIVHAELLETLPPSSRIWGTGMEHLLKGSFSVEGYGTLQLCLDPHVPPYILLETEDRTYLFGGEQAEEIYAMVQEE